MKHQTKCAYLLGLFAGLQTHRSISNRWSLDQRFFCRFEPQSAPPNKSELLLELQSAREMNLEEHEEKKQSEKSAGHSDATVSLLAVSDGFRLFPVFRVIRGSPSFVV